ncbi:unnamed protein product [Rotaria magnacalcarata]|uniref:Uncharacterized protein n=1 Tax=Rotaria magnacalcarata TaxID=392030 RepID=A0A8S2PZT9_9BILA|nr:unnamed protein product [Rotaria magnacalcarata]
MYSSRRNRQINDLHNNQTTTRMTTSALSSRSSSHSNRRATRSKMSLNGTLPFRLPSTNQVENRDREIERLHRVLDGGRSSDALSFEARLRSNEKIISNQNAQIDFLHETNRALERRVQELSELKRNLSDKQFEERIRNNDLLRDIKDFDRLARKVQADKDYTVEVADRELTEAKIEIQQNLREMQSLDAKVASLTTVRILINCPFFSI